MLSKYVLPADDRHHRDSRALCPPVPAPGRASQAYLCVDGSQGGRDGGIAAVVRATGVAATHLNESVRAALAAGEPVISVDTKKKELVGDPRVKCPRACFKNPGRAWRPQSEPEAVRVHDFLIKELGRAVPPAFAGAGCMASTTSHVTPAGSVLA